MTLNHFKIENGCYITHDADYVRVFHHPDFRGGDQIKVVLHGGGEIEEFTFWGAEAEVFENRASMVKAFLVDMTGLTWVSVAEKMKMQGYGMVRKWEITLDEYQRKWENWGPFTPEDPDPSLPVSAAV